MREEAEELIRPRIKDGMKVLDVGGGGGVSMFSTHVIDQMEYGMWLKDWKPKSVSISHENWVVRDVCDRSPWPYPDKFFDFVICSHILEDVRDPIWVCQEMSRVGKAGYVETPSSLLELTSGLNPGKEGKMWVGYLHHRWIVLKEDNSLSFRFKPYFLHSSRRFHFPPRYQERWLQKGLAYTYLIWEGECRAREILLIYEEAIKDDIEKIIITAEGRNLAIKLHEVKKYIWRIGKAWSQKTGIHTSIRTFFVRLRR